METKMSLPEIIHISRGGTSVVFDVSSEDQPIIVYWGPSLAPVSQEPLRFIANEKSHSGSQQVLIEPPA